MTDFIISSLYIFLLCLVAFVALGLVVIAPFAVIVGYYEVFQWIFERW